MPTSRHRTEHIHCLSPTNGRCIGTEESMGRTIPKAPNLRPTRRLERMADSSNSGAQSLRKCYHPSCTYRSPARIPAETRLLGTPINERTCRRKNHHRPSETSPGKRSDQSMGGETAGSETLRWRQSLVRRQESETPLSEPETIPKTVWTIQAPHAVPVLQKNPASSTKRITTNVG